MQRYITYAQLEEQLNHYTQSTEHLPFREAIREIVNRGDILTKPTIHPKRSLLSVEEFHNAIYQSSIPINDFLSSTDTTRDSSLIPNNLDIFAIKHVLFSKHSPYKHNSFTINFVYHGRVTFIFENEEHQMTEGELCIISPNSTYKIIPDNKDCIVIEIFIRKSTFDLIFSNTLSQIEPLSSFFKEVLYKNNFSSNYLLFGSTNSEFIREIIQNIYIETTYQQVYSNQIAINYTNLLFFNIVRYLEFKDIYYPLKNDKTDNYYQILLYIKDHFQEVTLESLSQTFNYYPSYISTLIKKEFGVTFNQYLTKIRMSEAEKMLTHTHDNLADISERIGYNSPDHFTRIFKKFFNQTPSEYRKQYGKN
ncbi:AraC family transcriptional regulator [Streptococcus moroccensis]|uniref:AraC-like DNA-binding protein/mannose-6-phosphate isomerase-like protein (Cupin superfamily) n=1 Tax=Streptococcus moroccensis TaxID=1451356 RepID=A0ABT9YUF1_9STRE|nr:AraC family transcriptional regulator [Streptococcus moroccensis]MDQ0223206.1 AraC-like DNA-binding protein/mannose-6-phosphate isomerase-like protein (cupin superfamily) [Streptococcus moroccensis]